MKKFRLESFQNLEIEKPRNESFKKLTEKNNLKKIENFLSEIKQKQDKLFSDKLQKDMETWYKKENVKNGIFINISLFISEKINKEELKKTEKKTITKENEQKILKMIQNKKTKKEENNKKIKKENSTLSSQKKKDTIKQDNSEISSFEELVIKKLSPLEESKVILTQVRKIKNYWFGFTQTHPFIFKKCNSQEGFNYCEESKDFSNKTLYKLK